MAGELGQLVAALIPVLDGVQVESFTLPLMGRVELGLAPERGEALRADPFFSDAAEARERVRALS